MRSANSQSTANSKPTLYRTAYPYQDGLQGFYTAIECDAHKGSEGKPLSWEVISSGEYKCERCEDEEIKRFTSGL